MERPTRTLIPLALAILALSIPVHADVLDQASTGAPEMLGSVDVNALVSRAQTFTVGTSGTLSRVRLVLAKSNTLPADEITIDLRPTDGSGMPLLEDATALGSVTVASGQLGTTIDVGVLFELDFSGEAIAVTEGERLAIVGRSAIPFGVGRQIAVGVIVGGTYAGGDAWVRTSDWSLQDGGNTDWIFETYVEVPEPASAASAALLTLLALARPRQKATI